MDYGNSIYFTQVYCTRIESKTLQFTLFFPTRFPINPKLRKWKCIVDLRQLVSCGNTPLQKKNTKCFLYIQL